MVYFVVAADVIGPIVVLFPLHAVQLIPNATNV